MARVPKGEGCTWASPIKGHDDPRGAARADRRWRVPARCEAGRMKPLLLTRGAGLAAAQRGGAVLAGTSAVAVCRWAEAHQGEGARAGAGASRAVAA